MPSAGVREQVAIVRANWRTGDAVIVNSGGTYSFAYYWPDQPTFVRAQLRSAVNFMVTYPDHPELVMVNGSAASTIGEALARARAAGGRIWIVFAHGTPSTVRRWTQEASRYGRIAHPGPRGRPFLVESSR